MQVDAGEIAAYATTGGVVLSLAASAGALRRHLRWGQRYIKVAEIQKALPPDGFHELRAALAKELQYVGEKLGKMEAKRISRREDLMTAVRGSNLVWRIAIISGAGILVLATSPGLAAALRAVLLVVVTGLTTYAAYIGFVTERRRRRALLRAVFVKDETSDLNVDPLIP